MRTVRDESGKRYLLLKRSAESSLVRDPETGERRHLPNDDLETLDGTSPFETAASGVPEPVRQIVTVARDDRTLGVLVDLVERGPLSVRELLATGDLCESDLHGLVGELRAAGLVTETEVAGERGYAATESLEDGIEALLNRE